LTPHVNDDGLIRLEIEQKMEELSGTGPLGPSTTKRTATTTVFARDQQTIIIGGLTRERTSEAAQKVPLLGDIPLIGFLFRNTQRTVEKQNIILALTPYVIHDPADLTRVLEAKIRDRREFVRLYGTPQERRMQVGPLGVPTTPGMLERINRAVRALDGGEVLTLRKTP
jgi:general secretion pathway protein D